MGFERSLPGFVVFAVRFGGDSTVQGRGNWRSSEAVLAHARFAPYAGTFPARIHWSRPGNALGNWAGCSGGYEAYRAMGAEQGGGIAQAIMDECWARCYKLIKGRKPEGEWEKLYTKGDFEKDSDSLTLWRRPGQDGLNEYRILGTAPYSASLMAEVVDDLECVNSS